MKTAPTPVIILTGFLGSGKTTLLNRWLANSLGVRIGVVVNDFGEINIDALMIARQAEKSIELGNGCMCCNADLDELPEALRQLATNEVDLIVIEASGIAESRPIISTVANAADAEQLTFGGSLYLVDAAYFRDTSKKFSTLAAQLKYADLLVLNKIDLVEPDEGELITRQLREINPTAALVKTVGAEVDLASIFEIIQRPPRVIPHQLGFDDLLREENSRACDSGHDAGEHLHEQFQSLSFSISGRMRPRELVDLLENPVAGVFRMKGVVYFGIKGFEEKYLVNTVGRFITVSSVPYEESELRVSSFVAIGVEINYDDLAARFATCAVPEPEDGQLFEDSQSMLTVLRYQ